MLVVAAARSTNLDTLVGVGAAIAVTIGSKGIGVLFGLGKLLATMYVALVLFIALVLAPTLIMRGQYDGIASMEDLLEFFKLLPNPDKQFAVMPGIAHNSTKAVNYQIAYHILHAFLTQPAPMYRG